MIGTETFVRTRLQEPREKLEPRQEVKNFDSKTILRQSSTDSNNREHFGSGQEGFHKSPALSNTSASRESNDENDHTQLSFGKFLYGDTNGLLSYSKDVLSTKRMEDDSKGNPILCDLQDPKLPDEEQNDCSHSRITSLQTSGHFETVLRYFIL